MKLLEFSFLAAAVIGTIMLDNWLSLSTKAQWLFVYRDSAIPLREMNGYAYGKHIMQLWYIHTMK